MWGKYKMIFQEADTDDEKMSHLLSHRLAVHLSWHTRNRANLGNFSKIAALFQIATTHAPDTILLDGSHLTALTESSILFWFDVTSLHRSSSHGSNQQTSTSLFTMCWGIWCLIWFVGSLRFVRYPATSPSTGIHSQGNPWGILKMSAFQSLNWPNFQQF